MGQVPHYLIIGAGRLATHFSHYLSLLDLPYSQWQRQQGEHALRQVLIPATHVLILISDDAIAPFIAAHPSLQTKTLVHCSGRLVLSNVASAHPLMTFAAQLESISWYQQIPFVIEQSGPSFATLLPGLNNSHYAIASQDKALYHALCVLSGNCTTLLWQKFQDLCGNKLYLPPDVIYPYLKQICHNLLTDGQAALTGPLPRQDVKTIAAHIDALTGDPFQSVYEAFVKAYYQES